MVGPGTSPGDIRSGYNVLPGFDADVSPKSENDAGTIRMTSIMENPYALRRKGLNILALARFGQADFYYNVPP